MTSQTIVREDSMFQGLRLGTNLYRFPDFSEDPRDAVTFVQTAERLGFSHVRFLDHVVGVAVEKHGGVAATPYSDASVIRECFILIAFLSAITSRIEFTTGVLVLPQRQTALVAKQAAEIDILSSGRLTLGVGLGYNEVEYEALGATFRDRASRFEEQVTVLRRLWTEQDVTFEGRFHKLTNVSLAPRPIQRPIPLFFGMGRTTNPIPPDAVLQRCGRLADGWLPLFQPDDEGRAAVAKVHAAAREAGRDPSHLVMEMAIRTEGLSAQSLRDEVRRRQDFGATRINLHPIGADAQAQTDSLQRIADGLGFG